MTKKYDYRITDERTSFKPFFYPWAYDAWLKHEQSHWLHTEVPMAEDVKDWKNKRVHFVRPRRGPQQRKATVFPHQKPVLRAFD